MSKLSRKHFPRYPQPYPSLETMMHIWEVLGWELRRWHNGVWELITPDGYTYAIMERTEQPAHECAWETFLDTSPYYEKTSLVTQQP
jgi:hypothetical protein